MVRELEEDGFDGCSAVARQIEGKLWELKLSQNRYFYVLFALVGDEYLTILHGYKKQSQKAPRNEIEVARKRMKRQLDVIAAAQKAHDESTKKVKK